MEPRHIWLFLLDEDTAVPWLLAPPTAVTLPVGRTIVIAAQPRLYVIGADA